MITELKEKIVEMIRKIAEEKPIRKETIEEQIALYKHLLDRHCQYLQNIIKDDIVKINLSGIKQDCEKMIKYATEIENTITMDNWLNNLERIQKKGV